MRRGFCGRRPFETRIMTLWFVSPGNGTFFVTSWKEMMTFGWLYYAKERERTPTMIMDKEYTSHFVVIFCLSASGL